MVMNAGQVTMSWVESVLQSHVVYTSEGVSNMYLQMCLLLGYTIPHTQQQIPH